MLTGKAIERLVSVTMFDNTRGDARARAEAREAVEAAAEELGFSATDPPLPARGESLVEAAVRVLELPVDKPLAQHRAQAASASAEAERVAGLEARKTELRQIEHARRRDAVLAKKTVGAPPRAAVDEWRAITAELDLIGANDIGGVVRTSEGQIRRDAAAAPDALASTAFYCSAVISYLQWLAGPDLEHEVPYRALKQAAGELETLLRPLQYQGGDEVDELRAVTSRVRRAVEDADLHRGRRLPELSVEELAGARRAPAAVGS